MAMITGAVSDSIYQSQHGNIGKYPQVGHGHFELIISLWK